MRSPSMTTMALGTSRDPSQSWPKRRTLTAGAGAALVTTTTPARTTAWKRMYDACPHICRESQKVSRSRDADGCASELIVAAKTTGTPGVDTVTIYLTRQRPQLQDCQDRPVILVGRLALLNRILKEGPTTLR